MPTRSQLQSLDYYMPMLSTGLRIAFILLVAYFCSKSLRRVLNTLRDYTIRMMMKAGGGTEFEIEKRVQTIGGVARKALLFLIWVMACLTIMKELNFDVRPLLAGASVIGVAVGFGAQSVVKDILNGLFLLTENQLRINDVAVINGTGGLVEEINLRTTILRGEDGVHVFPNGSISTLTNMTREYSYHVVNVTIPYTEDIDHVIKVLREIGEQMTEQEPYSSAILAPLEVLGIDHLTKNGASIKARFKTLPSKQWMVGREMNRLIKTRFQEAEIELPGTSQTVQIASLAPELRDELKQLVREVLKESGKSVG